MVFIPGIALWRSGDKAIAVLAIAVQATLVATAVKYLVAG